MTGAAQAALGVTTQSTVAFGYDLCYRPAGTTNPLVNFSGSNYTIASTTAKSGCVSFSATSSIAPGVGSWDVGYCVKNSSAYDLNSNSNVNGWVMVTN
jgi:hypothetical protein